MENPILKKLKTRLIIDEKKKRECLAFDNGLRKYKLSQTVSLIPNIQENDELFERIKELFSKVAVLVYYDRTKNVPVMRYEINGRKLFLQYEEQEKRFYLVNRNNMIPIDEIITNLVEDEKSLLNKLSIGTYAKMYQKDLLNIFKFGWQ